MEPLALEREPVSLGRGAGNTVVLNDPKVSRVHAMCERVGDVWCVRDLSSSNGTFRNGSRVNAAQPLHNGDEIRLGDTRIVYRAASPQVEQRTTPTNKHRLPELTRRERDVLQALCRPLRSTEAFPEPATTKEISKQLVVSDAAVRQHLLALYDKFGIGTDEGSRRRVRLAREAIRRGAVALDALESS